MTQTAAELETLALANCDSEPIHIPGYIQSFGCLLAMTIDADEFVYASANASDFVGITAEELLGMSPGEVFSGEQLHLFRNILGRSTAFTQRELAGEFVHGDHTFSVSMHRRDDLAIIELISVGETPRSQDDALNDLRWLTSQIDATDTIDELLAISVSILRMATGFDRVMAYRFRPDGSGEIVAEDRRFSADSFLGLRFPAYDIPAQARELYLTTPIRMIADNASESIPLVGAPGRGALDLSLAVLRGSMPVHTQYLQNMGVQGTMTLPLVVGGELWGMFSFHHMEARHLGEGQDLIAELAARYVSMAISAMQERKLASVQSRAVPFANSLVVMRETETVTEAGLQSILAEMSTLLDSCGIAYVTANSVISHGITPSNLATLKLVNELPNSRRSVAFTNSLAELVGADGLGDVGGAIGFTLGSDEDPFSLFFFRQLSSSVVRWAGKPEKDIQVEGAETRLVPRSSFAEYEASVDGKSDEWEHVDVEVVNGVLRAIETSVPVLSADRDALVDVVVQELNHRVRNVLALVQSVMRQSRPKSPEMQQPFESLERRVLSLATAHNVLSDDSSKSLDLASTLLREGAPFPDEALQLSGPSVSLSADAVSVVLLVIHELFTNSAKHGALSATGGVVDISWRLKVEGLALTWAESGGPKVEQPRDFGFGYNLIANALPYQLEGEANVDFRPGGLVVDLLLPTEYVVATTTTDELSTVQPAAAADQATVPEQRVLSGEVLVLEDDFLVAALTQVAATELGAEVIHPASSNEAALEIIDQANLDFAIIDINIRGDRSGVVAGRLTQVGVPFVFLTGYDSNLAWLVDFEDAVMIRKPVSVVDLRNGIVRALRLDTVVEQERGTT